MKSSNVSIISCMRPAARRSRSRCSRHIGGCDGTRSSRSATMITVCKRLRRSWPMIQHPLAENASSSVSCRCVALLVRDVGRSRR